MKILRKLLVSLLAIALSTVLFGATWSRIGMVTIHDRQAVKGWFNKSGFYNQISDVIIEKAKLSAKSSDISSIAVGDPEIQAIAKNAFNPAFLQKNVEGVLDGSYNWLDGSAQELKFSIDLTDAKQQFASGIGNYATNRVSALPTCNAGQGGGEFDAFKATCRPPGISAAAVGKQASDSMLTQDFLKNPVLTADNLKVKNSNGISEPITDNINAQIARTVYQKSSALPLALIFTAIILSLGIVLISSNRIRGIRRVGYVFASTGVFLGISYIIMGYGLNAVATKLASNGSPMLNKLAVNLLNIVIEDIKSVLVICAGSFIVFGIACYIAAHILKKRQTPDTNPALKHHVTDSSKPEDITDTKKGTTQSNLGEISDKTIDNKK